MSGNEFRITVIRTPISVRIIGAIFLLAGLAFSGIFIWTDRNHLDVNNRTFSLLFSIIGILLLGIHYRKIVDISRHEVQLYWGFYFWIKLEVPNIGKWEKIQVGPSVLIRGSDRKLVPFTPVKIIGEKDSIELMSEMTIEKAMKFAENISQLSKIELVDATKE